ncbi:MAG: alpha/beta hydrolase, partial [Dehalococcoidia bacterium]|nr:alpha/beta hydrolase [Dehalococcoidia bacterium]
MALQKQELTVKGLPVTITENPDQPLLMLVRMAARGMRLWDRVWDHFASYYTVANFDLPAEAIDRFDSSQPLMEYYARLTVEVAQDLGFNRFHLFGWGGGARVALRCLVDYPDRLHSCIVFGFGDRPPDPRAVRKNAEVVDLILDSGNLELYTYNWILNSVSQQFALEHFDEIEKLVAARMEADKGRMDTRNVKKWIYLLRRPPATIEELQKVTVPTLLVTPDSSFVAQLHQAMPSSQVAVIPGSRQFVMVEDPGAFIAAVGPFMRAAARGKPPAEKLVGKEGSSLVRVKDSEYVQLNDNRPESAIVFLHGWLMSPEMWSHSIKALEGKIRCIALWQPGHGRSSAPGPGFTMESWADTVMQTLDNLNVKRVVIVGHSMGGMLSLQIALKYPDRISGMVLVDTQDTAWDEDRNTRWMQTVGFVAKNWSQTTAPSIAGFLLGENFIKSHPGWVTGWAEEVAKYDLHGQLHLGGAIANRPDFSARLPEIKIPALVVHGSVDQAIAPDVGKTIAQRIPGAEYKEIPGAAHCPPLETPEAFTNILISFLSRKG